MGNCTIKVSLYDGISVYPNNSSFAVQLYQESFSDIYSDDEKETMIKNEIGEYKLYAVDTLYSVFDIRPSSVSSYYHENEDTIPITVDPNQYYTIKLDKEIKYKDKNIGVIKIWYDGKSHNCTKIVLYDKNEKELFTYK